MEALPDATIDVGGGSQSLDIEGLGVKRKKNDLSAVTSSTSSLAIEDLFGDLLDGVNFSDPNSVDAFRNSAVSRINEFDSASLSNILGEASTVAGDLATVTTPFLGKDTSQDQFQQVFGPSRVAPDTVESEDLNVGFDTATSTEAQDISSLTNPGVAASLFGGAFGTFGTGGTPADFAFGLGTQAVGRADVVGALGGFSDVLSVSNALDRGITDVPSALNAVSAGLGVAQTVARASELINSGVTISSLFERATKNVGEFIEGVYSAVTNPGQAMEAYGRGLQYGTMTPDLYSFDFPGGPMKFAFDAKTGLVATPGLIGAMMPMGIRAAYGIGQFAMDKVGYTEAMADRNQSAVNAFSTPGVTKGQMSVHSSSVDALTGVDPETGAASTVGAFGAVDMSDYAYGTVGMDLGAMAAEMGPDGKVTDLDFDTLQTLSISGHLGHGPIDLEEAEQIASAMHSTFNDAGLGTAQGIASAAEQASQARAAFTTEFQALTGIDLSKSEVADVAGRAGALSASTAAAQKEFPGATLASSLADPYENPDELARTRPERAYAFEEQRQQAIQSAADTAAANAFSYDAGGYNSNNPSNRSIDLAEKTMAATGLNRMDPNNEEQQQVARDIARSEFSISTQEGAKGSFDAGFGDKGKSGAQDMYDRDPLSEMDITDAGDGDGTDDKVICTALKDMGLLDKELWKYDGVYGRTLPLETRQGYWEWGVPTAKFIRKNRWAAKGIRPVVTEVAKEMAHRVGYGKGSKLGAALLYVGLPVCHAISRIKNNGNNTRSIYS